MTDLEAILAVTFSGIRTEEYDAVRDLLAACRLHTEDLSDAKLAHFIVARKGTRVVGTAGLEIAGDAGLLRSLAVEPAYRRQGIAAALTASIQKYARLQNVSTLYLLTLTAEAYFTKAGFHTIDRAAAPDGIRETEEFSTFCPETAVCMVRRLD